MDYIQIINSRLADLTKSEKKIADYIFEKPDQFVNSTMQSLKDEIGVGDATISRFCKKLGFNGFVDLKIQVAKDSYTSTASQTESNLLDNLFATLQRTKNSNSIESLHTVIDIMQEARNIYIFGVGHSGIIATDFEKSLLRIGVRAHAVTDTQFQMHTAVSLGADDLIIAISLSGNTKDLVRSCKLAFDNEVSIIAITNHYDSDLAELADCVLQTHTDEFIDGGSLSGKFSQLLVCQLVIDYYEHNVSSEKSLNLREKVARTIYET